jgi:dienelactone hydrolase
MRVLIRALCVLSVVAASSCGSRENAAPPTAKELSPGVWGLLELPRGPGPHPAVVLLHGSVGWRPEYVDIARSLAHSGFAALALDYYAGVGPAAIGSSEKLQKWSAYRAAVRRAVAYLRSLPEVGDRPIGLVGYSRGAFLAVSVASSIPDVRAVVDYYGGGGGGTDSLAQEVRGFPPLLILHGEADKIVPVRFAEALRNAVIAAGGEAEMHLYPGVGHAFNGPWAPTYSEDATLDAHRRTVDFLRRRLE